MDARTEDRGSALLGQGPVPLRFFGAGFYLAWLFTIHYSTGVFETADRALDSLILSNLSNLAGLVAAALSARRIAPISTKRGFVAGAGAFSSVGTVAASLAPLAQGAEAALFVAGNAFIGIGTTLLILLWSELYSSLPRRETSVFYSGSFVVAAGLFYLVSMLEPTIQMASVTLLPVASATMLALSGSLLPNRAEEVKESTDPGWTFPWRPSILLAVYAFASTLSRSMSFEANDVGMAGMLLIALVVLASNVFLFDRFDARMLYKVTPPGSAGSAASSSTRGSPGSLSSRSSSSAPSRTPTGSRPFGCSDSPARSAFWPAPQRHADTHGSRPTSRPTRRLWEPLPSCSW